VAGEIVLDGRLHRGAAGRAGELANVEGTPWFAANLWLHRNGPATTAALCTAAPRGAAAVRLVAGLAGPLAEGLFQLVHTIDSALIVIGGGLAQSGASLLDPVAAVLRDRCCPPLKVTT